MNKQTITRKRNSFPFGLTKIRPRYRVASYPSGVTYHNEFAYEFLHGVLDRILLDQHQLGELAGGDLVKNE